MYGLPQVMSDTVSKALQLTGGSEVQETAKFVLMADRFFDCMNVNSYDTGRLKRKIFKQPYRSATDFRLKVCMLCAYSAFVVGLIINTSSFVHIIVVEGGVSWVP